MNKRSKKIIASSILISSLACGINVSNANAFNDSTTNVVESNQGAINSKEDIENNSNYKIINITKTEEKLSDNIVMEVETIKYEILAGERAISNGTNFGTYSTIKMRDQYYGRYWGTVGVDVQGKRISSTQAKINYIRYSNSDFGRASKGAYGTFGVGKTGNPAKGGVYVQFTAINTDGQTTSEERAIIVRVYPNGNINIGG